MTRKKGFRSSEYGPSLETRAGLEFTMSQQEVADALKISRARVSQIERSALKKLREFFLKEEQ